MQKINLHILSKTCGENENPPVDQRLTGEMGEKNGVKYAFYKETGEGMEGVRTALKWTDNSLVISRSGAVECCQEFRPDYCCHCVYKTPYLEIPLVSTTKKLVIVGSGKQHRLDVEYDLAHGDAHYGRMEIVIEIEEIEA